MDRGKYRGKAVHRGQPGADGAPPTGELSKAARDIIRYLEAGAHEARLADVSANLTEFRRAEIQHAVDQLEAAGMVHTHPDHGEPVIRLLHPFTEAGGD